MSFSKKILKAINEGVIHALSFDKNELESSEEFELQNIPSANAINDSKISIIKRQIENKVNELMDYPSSMNQQCILILKDIVNIANEYGVKYVADNDIIKPLIQKLITLNIKVLDLNWIDTSHVTSMKEVFSQIFPESRIKVKKVLVNEWDVSNVRDMSYMFYSNQNYELYGLDKWNVSNVENMAWMFYQTYFLRDDDNGIDEDLYNWDVSNVKDMNHMFTEAIFDGYLDLWAQKLHHVEDTNCMFSFSSFNNDSICDWDVSNIKDATAMFSNDEEFCQDLSKWKFAKRCKTKHFCWHTGMRESQLPKQVKPIFNEYYEE